MGQGETKGVSASHVEDDDGIEPSYSQVLANGSRPSLRPSLRPSIRPSAFGPPRHSTRPPAPLEDSSVEIGADEQDFAQMRALGSNIDQEFDSPKKVAESALAIPVNGRGTTEEPTPSGARRRVRNPEHGTPIGASIASSQSQATFRADLEDLLPFVSAKSSVPPTLPALPDKPAARPQDPKRNRLSLAIFGVMLLSSIVPLARYAASDSKDPSVAASRQEPARQRSSVGAEPAPVLNGPLDSAGTDGQPTPPPANEVARPPLQEKLPADPMLAALAQAEANLPEDPAAAADLLMSQGLKALAAGDERFAEALLGRALKRDDDNPRAYFALARIRMSQGNLQGAEGWIVSALHKRPRRAEYHTFYATVLDGLGRTTEAAAARARANELRADRPEQ